MWFEFDPKKSTSNRVKHGIDFHEAQVVWEDENHIALLTDFMDEERWLIVGRIGQKIWTVVYTERLDSIRIISARRASKKEIEAYEKE